MWIFNYLYTYKYIYIFYYLYQNFIISQFIIMEMYNLHGYILNIYGNIFSSRFVALLNIYIKYFKYYIKYFGIDYYSYKT